jgi:hypothetical protein
MKLVRYDGRDLEVREVSEPIYSWRLVRFRSAYMGGVCCQAPRPAI